MPEAKLVNLWGADDLLVYRDGEWIGWDRELTPWLRAGTLLWLDESATLRSDGCPFVDLPGRRLFTVIANGTVQHRETPSDR